MRLLVDEHGLDWDDGLGDHAERPSPTRTTRCCPRRWKSGPLPLFAAILPRHLEIIYEINRRFLDEVRARYPGDEARVAPAVAHRRAGRALRAHGPPGLRRQPRDQRRRRAAHRPAEAGRCCSDFHELWPEKFSNMTNGVTPRRFLVLANPRLAALITDSIGDGWVRDLEELRALEPLAEDAAFQRRVAARQAGRTRSAWRPSCAHRTGVAVDPASPVRRPGEAHPRVQAPAPERAARRSPSTTGSGETRALRDRRAPSSSAARPPPATSWPS